MAEDGEALMPIPPPPQGPPPDGLGYAVTGALSDTRGRRQSRLVMGRAVRAASVARVAKEPLSGASLGADTPTGSSKPSTGQMEDQFRAALGEPGGGRSMFEAPTAEELGAISEKGGGDGGSSLGAGERSQLEAAIAERTKALNRTFEDQVKKQYELMRREVSKLAKQHQRDVHALDQRFRQKMAGLASRFQALEAEEARMAMVKKENEELQAEVQTQIEKITEGEAREQKLHDVISERDAAIEGLESTITTMAEKAVALQQEMAERKAAMEALQGELQVPAVTDCYAACDAACYTDYYHERHSDSFIECYTHRHIQNRHIERYTERNIDRYIDSTLDCRRQSSSWGSSSTRSGSTSRRCRRGW